MDIRVVSVIIIIHVGFIKKIDQNYKWNRILRWQWNS